MSEYYSPKNLIEALRIKSANPDAVLLAGGTDLLVQFRKNGFPQKILDISAVEELHEISILENTYSIGSMVTFTRLSESSIARELPVLFQAISNVGSVQVRNRGTIGGNICNANPAADLIPLWAVWNSEVELAKSENGAITLRRMPLTSFIDRYMHTVLEENEILTKLVFRKPEGKTAFFKVARREALAISRMSIAVCIRKENTLITKTSICVGAVSEKPRRLYETERFLNGKQFRNIDIEETADRGTEECFLGLPVRSSTSYKKTVLRNILKALLRECID